MLLGRPCLCKGVSYIMVKFSRKITSCKKTWTRDDEYKVNIIIIIFKKKVIDTSKICTKGQKSFIRKPSKTTLFQLQLLKFG